MKRRRNDSSNPEWGKNREMNDDTYKLRRMVMDYIYQAKRIYETLTKKRWPRITIRISDLTPEKIKQGIVGYANMTGFIVWVPATTLTFPKSEIHEIVFHELLHAIYGIKHDESNKLMSATMKYISDEETDTLFTNYIKQHENINEIKFTKSYLKKLIKEEIKKCISEQQLFKGTITLNKSVVNNINKELNIFNTKLQDEIPLQPIFDILKKYELTPLQEDGTEWSGFLLGTDSNTTIELGYSEKIINNFVLHLSWYKYHTGRYEINTYLS